ncbi:MAG: hypothetical protein ABJH04_07435 [Cyclobacteriaceae bacterium]
MAKFLDQVSDIIRQNSDNPLVGALEIQRYMSSILLSERAMISQVRKEGYSVGWNDSADNILSIIAGTREVEKSETQKAKEYFDQMTKE